MVNLVYSFDASFILYLVAGLSAATLLWNSAVLYYCYRSRQLDTEITRSRPMKRWILKALIVLVSAETAGLVVLSIVQITRNAYLVDAVGTDVAPDWLFWVVILQNLLFYALNTLPAVILFAYVWGLKSLLADREDRLTEVERSDLGMEDRATARERRSQDPEGQH
jgi:hypothetical protein